MSAQKALDSQDIHTTPPEHWADVYLLDGGEVVFESPGSDTEWMASDTVVEVRR